MVKREKEKTRMNQTVYRFLCAGMAAVFLLCASCAPMETADYTLPDMENVPSGIAAENSRFILQWDDSAKALLFTDKRTGRSWGSTPYEYLQSGKFNMDLLSPIMVEYVNLEDSSLQTGYGVDCIDENAVSVKKVENGLHLTFYFTEAKITAAMTVRLCKDGLEASLETDEIQEAGDCRLLRVSLLPYLCSAKNTQSQSSYLFLPTGSGALMYTDGSADGLERKYHAEVYGDDPAQASFVTVSEDEPIRLPVFGVKEGDSALCAIITENEGAARINAGAGDPIKGYSAVGASFTVRGFNNTEWDTGKQSGGEQLFQDAFLLAKNRLQNRRFTIRYTPLADEQADYNGMAAVTRSYLNEQGWLETSGAQAAAIHLEIIGGAQVKRFAAGIPYHTVTPLTTFTQAREIIEGTVKEIGAPVEAVLRGFGSTGLDAGKTAGGYAFASVLGKEKEQQELEQACASNSVSLYTDFDLIRYQTSGAGLSAFGLAAMTANSQTVQLTARKRNVYSEDESVGVIRLLRREKLGTVMEKLCRFAENRISGISLYSWGQTAYSDYREERFAVKGDLSAQALQLLSGVKKAGHTVSLAAANAYAAGLCDSIYHTPLQDGGYLAFDQAVPFYAMVYRGSIPLYSTALNLAPDAEDLLLRAAEAGVSPSFAVSARIDNELAGNAESLYYGTVFEGNRELIAKAAGRMKDYLAMVGNAGIQKHSILGTGLAKTDFTNGVTVRVNHTDREQNIDGKAVAARSFDYEKQG